MYRQRRHSKQRRFAPKRKPSPVFKFKQFTVRQDRCGMKVTTDSCIFGAVVADYTKKHQPQSILDVGTGTGLLSLMLAQTTSCPIDAVEIDADAYLQADENFASNSWATRMKVHHSPIQDFPDEPDGRTYDLIISNPPFFKNHMQSRDRSRARAMHNDELPPRDLALSLKRLISQTGIAFVMLPRYEMYSFSKEMRELGFYEHNETCIFNQPGKGVFRSIKAFSLVEPILRHKENLVVRDQESNYTWRFKALLDEYYLKIQ